MDDNYTDDAWTRQDLKVLHARKAAGVSLLEPRNPYALKNMPDSPSPKSLNIEDPAVTEFESMCARLGVAPEIKNALENTLTHDQLLQLEGLFTSDKAKEREKGREFLGLPPNPEDQKKAEKEGDINSPFINAMKTIVGVVLVEEGLSRMAHHSLRPRESFLLLKSGNAAEAPVPTGKTASAKKKEFTQAVPLAIAVPTLTA